MDNSKEAWLEFFFSIPSGSILLDLAHEMRIRISSLSVGIDLVDYALESQPIDVEQIKSDINILRQQATVLMNMNYALVEYSKLQGKTPPQ